MAFYRCGQSGGNPKWKEFISSSRSQPAYDIGWSDNGTILIPSSQNNIWSMRYISGIGATTYTRTYKVLIASHWYLMEAVISDSPQVVTIQDLGVKAVNDTFTLDTSEGGSLGGFILYTTG